MPAALRCPTTTVEVEDSWIRKSGQGTLWPDRWKVDRTRFRGSWLLRDGETISIPVTAGSARLTLILEHSWIRNHDEPLELTVLGGKPGAKETLLQWTAPPGDGEWQTTTVGPVPWEAGTPLVFQVKPSGQQPPNAVLLDRCRLEWR
jgi:hypothetical protein